MPVRLSNPIACAAIAALLALGSPALGDPNAPQPFETAGWPGSWFYNSRDIQAAFYVRGPEDRPELRFELRHQARPEQFLTDWNGEASYFISGQPATFRLELHERGPEMISGEWRHEYGLGDRRFVERGPFTLRRTGDGRFARLEIPELSMELHQTDGAVRQRTIRREWTFRKVSRRVVSWDELPF